MLNFSRVNGSGLTAADFVEQGIPNVVEVFEFPKYGAGGEIVKSSTATYNVRFESVNDCANWWKAVKSGETKPVLNNILCKVQIYKDNEKVQLDKKFKKKEIQKKREQRAAAKSKRYTISDSA